jgi:hypothetical protein
MAGALSNLMTTIPEIVPIMIPEFYPDEYGEWTLEEMSMPPVFRGYHSGLSVLEPQQRPDYCLRHEQEIWMSTSPGELESQSLPIHFAHGTVCMMGLGMGILLYNLIQKEEVKKVHVVELNSDVIHISQNMSDVWMGKEAKKIELHQENALWFEPDFEIDYLDVYIWEMWGQTSMEKDVERINRQCKPKCMSWWSMEMQFVTWMSRKDYHPNEHILGGPPTGVSRWEEWGQEIGIPIPVFEGATGRAINACENAINW